MRAALDDATGIEHDDVRGARSGGDAVRDSTSVRPSPARSSAFRMHRLGPRVDGGERVVEHEHRRLVEESARERDALLLAARELDAALADDRLEAVGQPVDLLEDRRLGGCAADAVHRVGSVRVVEGEADVALDRRREEERLLLRVADLGAERAQLGPS